jgi:hypothetical protein
MANHHLFHLLVLCFLSTSFGFILHTPLFQAFTYTKSRKIARTSAAVLRSTCQLKISDLAHIDPKHKVKAIITDVDRTLFNSKHSLGPDTRAVICERGIPVVVATGKSRGPWVQQLRASLGLPGQSWNLNGPSVFIQGLMVCDSADRIICSRLLSAPMAHEMDLFASSRGITIIAYTTDDRIVARQVVIRPRPPPPPVSVQSR